MGGDPKAVFHKLCQTRTRRLTLVLGMLACTVLVFRTFTLPSMNPSPPAFATGRVSELRERQGVARSSSSESQRVGELALLSNRENYSSVETETIMDTGSSLVEGSRNYSVDDSGERRTESHSGKTEAMNLDLDDDTDDGSDVDDEDVDPDEEFSINLGGGVTLKKGRDPVDGFITLVKVNDSEGTTGVVNIKETVDGFDSGRDSNRSHKALALTTDGAEKGTQNGNSDDGALSTPNGNSTPMTMLDRERHGNDTSSSQPEVVKAASSRPSSDDPGTGPRNSSTYSPLSNFTVLSDNNSESPRYPLVKRKKRAVPTASITEMTDLLFKAHRSYRTMRPRWSSPHDQRILSIREQINNPPIVKNDRELHGPAFRNLSMFKRSYELMEKTLKVYVYREGQKPIFHQPLLKGIYASEGWFMKHMEGNRQFVVKDPRKALLYYMPFSSRFLEFTLYVRNSHNRTNLRAFLQNYVDTIAAKYPFWNRTGGTDHFLVACHDWAPFETKNTMERSIRALCNADLSNEFRLGKDVSLPETYVRFGRDPLRDIGGKPADQRTILAFYAGNMHGYLRPILLNHWENKDPGMKIYGPMPKGVKSKMNYIEHMKRSKYCICPRGYEVNSPRVVEAIFYECVPVIISDNYIPPFFEVLNWEAFAVFVAEADISKLKDILLSIPEDKYRDLQLGVRMVQKHFIWHTKPVKYDLFHMTLHSIWYNRVHTLKSR